MGFSSQAGKVVLRKQSVPGTLAADLATAGIALPLRSGALATSRELLVPDPEIGGGRDIRQAYLGAVSWAGDYELYVRPDGIATLLYGTLGAAEAPVTATGVTTHTITSSDAAQLPFYSIHEEIGAGLELFNYTDCVMNTLHLESDANGYLMGTVGIIGARGVAAATAIPTPTWDEGPMFVGTNILVTYGGVTLPAKSFSLDINNNFSDDDFRLGSFFLGDLTPQGREVTASFNIRETSSALWRQATLGAAAATTVQGTTVVDDLVIHAETYETIGATATRYSLDITIPNYVLKPYSFSVSGADVIESDIEGQALRPDSGIALMTAVVKTETATIA